jgi:hypothetical protein
MAFILILAGLVLFVTAYQGTTGQLGSMLVQDVFGTQGQGGFIYWIVAIGIVGAVGYIKSLKGLSDAFIGLLLLVLFISNKGFFAKFNAALGQIGGTASGYSGQKILTFGGATTQPSYLSPGVLTAPGVSVPFNITGTGS